MVLPELTTLEMNLALQTIRTLLLVTAVVCFWTRVVQPQTENKPGDSTIRGTAVYSDTGHPVRHARITRYDPENGRQEDTVSDLRGHFVFANVPAGKYLLAVEAPGLLEPYSNVARVETMIMKPRWPDKHELLTEVTVNGTDSIDVKVNAVRGGVITGRVVTEDDQPLAKADIKLLRRENGKWAPVWNTWSNRVERGDQKTDANGVFRIAALPSGEYRIRVSEPSFPEDSVPGDEDAYSDGSFMVTYYPAATSVKDAEVVSVVAGSESTGIDIRLTERPVHTLTGTVKFAGIGQPRGNVNVTIERSDEVGYSTRLQEPTARVDSEGKWQVSGLPAGEYLVTFAGGLITTNMDRGPEMLQALSKSTTVRIGEEKVKVLNTTLTFGAQVKGKVTLKDKSPEAEWFMMPSVRPADESLEEAEEDIDSSRFHIGIVGRDARFTITALKPGTYWFSMSLEEKIEAYVKSVTRKGVDLMEAPFKVTEDQVFDEVEVTLARDFARVEGQISMPEGSAKQPLTVILAPATEVTRRFNSGMRTLESDAKGKIVFRSAPGEYLVAALPTSDYEKIVPHINYKYVDKNADKFLRIKLRAGEKVKALAVPMLKK